MRKDNSSLAIKDEIFFQFLFIFSLSYYVLYRVVHFCDISKVAETVSHNGETMADVPPTPSWSRGGGRKCKLQNY